MSRRTWIILILGVVVVAAVIAVIGRRSAAAAASSQALDRTTTITRGPIDVVVSGTGNIDPRAQADLSFNVNGNIGNIYVKVGDRVKAGDILMDLDPSSIDVTLIGAEADLLQAEQKLNDLLDQDNWKLSLAQAQSNLAAARDELHTAEYNQSVRAQGNRASQKTILGQEGKVLLAKKTLDQAKQRACDGTPDDHDCAQAAINLSNAQQAYDSAVRTLNWYTGHPTDIEQAQLDSAVAVAQAKVDQAQKKVDILTNGPDPDQVAAARANVQAAQVRVNQSKITAPFDGTITAVYYKMGDKVTPGKAGIGIADDSQFHIQTTVDELDIASVQLGQNVSITLDALPGKVLDGKVDEIDLAPDPSQSTTEYPVVVSVSNPGPEARIGMTASVDINVSHKDQALLVPNWALRVDTTTGQVYVMVKKGTNYERQDIKLGLRNDTDSEVLDGLQAGDVVGVPPEAPSSPSFGGPFGGG
ncbi:MAG: efflux RND transporter periplasmic adaptor subunit [Anaerolineales bacterium]|jgi:HlyD family secretion protein